jgi:glycerophosphoryl diester phosphodiesterase
MHRPEHRLELVAHRGFAARYPENTHAALAAAIEAGARFVEVDVQLSSDGEPFLFHDRTLQRICGHAGALHELPADELRQLHAAETGKFGQAFADEPLAPLADLSELLTAYPDVFAFVELKRIAIEHFGAERVITASLRDLAPVLASCALISFDLAALKIARTLCDLPLGAVFDRWRQMDVPAYRSLAPEYVFTDVYGLPAKGPLVPEHGQLAVYEVADPAFAIHLAERGVQLVETFDIAGMLAALAGA